MFRLFIFLIKYKSVETRIVHFGVLPPGAIVARYLDSSYEDTAVYTTSITFITLF